MKATLIALIAAASFGSFVAPASAAPVVTGGAIDWVLQREFGDRQVSSIRERAALTYDN